MVTVNASIAHARMGETDKAEKSLRKALETAPDSAAVHFNLGLPKAEQNDSKQAEFHLKADLKSDPQMAQAAFNLCILLSKDRVEEAVGFCKNASNLRPDDPRYAFTLAFYLHQKGETSEAISTLRAIVEKHPEYREAQNLLGEIVATGQKP